MLGCSVCICENFRTLRLLVAILNNIRDIEWFTGIAVRNEGEMSQRIRSSQYTFLINPEHLLSSCILCVILPHSSFLWLKKKSSF